jgi:serine/threonine protein kinase
MVLLVFTCREVQIRDKYKLEAGFVVGTEMAFNADEDLEVERAIAKEPLFSNYPYILVMPKGDRSLSVVLTQEHIAADLQHVKPIAQQLAAALQHIHQKGIVHGDCKPLNCLRIGEKWMLIDLDAAVPLGGKVGAKYSSAFVPPELVHVNQQGKPEIKTWTTSDEGEVPSGAYELVDADTSVDMWGLGAVLYHMCTGFRLFDADQNDNVDQKTLLLLACWDRAVKSEKLAKVKDPLAKNLLARLLQKDPKHRPHNMGQVLAHPFFSGKKAARLQGEAALVRERRC